MKGNTVTTMCLSVIFRSIRRHEGSIEVDSEPGRGTTFKISLPKVSSTETKSEPNLVTAGTTSAEDKMRVLVVDDETHVHEVMSDALESEGCEVISAPRGEV